MLGFYCDVFNDNQAKLMVQYYNEADMEPEELQNIRNNPSFYIGDTISGAINYFNLYTKDDGLYKYTQTEAALDNIGISTTEAAEFREKIDSILSNLDDETALENTLLYPKWVTGKSYAVDDRVKYNNKLYRVLQAHTSQANWTPSAAASLFARVLVNTDIEEWEQPDSTNGYAVGDRVRYKGHIYESLINNNVWSPEGYAQGWQLIE